MAENEKDSYDNDEETKTRLRGILERAFTGSKNDPTSGEKPTDQQKRPSTIESFQSTANLAASVKRWKQRSKEGKRKLTTAVDERHQEAMVAISDRIVREVPRPLLITIRQEALRIVQRTNQDYKSILGNKHNLTQESADYLELLKHETGQD